MEQVCSAFHSYDFLSDAAFVSGWNGISQNIPDEVREEELMKAKLFYFSRNFHSITIEEYKHWLNKLNGTVTTYASVVDYSHPLVYGDRAPPAAEPVPQANMSMPESSMDTACVEQFSKLNLTDQDQSSSHSDTTSTEAMEAGDTLNTNTNNTDDPNYPVSFYDLMWMIEKGEKIPGVDELNVEPTNEIPTTSALTRTKKPWEL